MKIIAIIGIIALVCWMALEVDSTTGWIDKFIYLIRERLGFCNHIKRIIFEEEYNKEGEPFYHHTYKITKCDKCGKEFNREQLQ